MAAGATRTYQSPDSASGTITYTLTNVQATSFDQHTSYQPSTSATGGGVVAVTVEQTDSFRCDPDGLFQTGHLEQATYTDGSTATVTFHDYTAPLLPRSPAPGMTWDYAFIQEQTTPDGTAIERYEDHVTAGGPEAVSVPAGTFQALRLDHSATTTPLNFDDAPHQVQVTEWLAPGVGTVRDASRELVAFASGPQDCAAQGAEATSQAQQDAAGLHAAEDPITDPGDNGSSDGSETLVAAQASVSDQALLGALAQIGLPANRVAEGPEAGLLRFRVRLGADNRPLLSLAALDDLLARTCVQPGSLRGAQSLVLGAVQQSGDQVRVTVRSVDVATGEIRASSLADGTVTTLAATLESALAGLPIDLTPP